MSFTLPSKRFLIALGTAIGLIVVTLGVIEGVKFLKNKIPQNIFRFLLNMIFDDLRYHMNIRFTKVC